MKNEFDSKPLFLFCLFCLFSVRSGFLHRMWGMQHAMQCSGRGVSGMDVLDKPYVLTLTSVRRRTFLRSCPVETNTSKRP